MDAVRLRTGSNVDDSALWPVMQWVRTFKPNGSTNGVNGRTTHKMSQVPHFLRAPTAPTMIP
jgi:hypothetical protein